MKNLKNIDFFNLKGSTREEIINNLGDDFLSESDDNCLLYCINKTWLKPKGELLYIGFNDDNKVDTILFNIRML